jgi:hypothetical protein
MPAEAEASPEEDSCRVCILKLGETGLGQPLGSGFEGAGTKVPVLGMIVPFGGFAGTVPPVPEVGEA